MAHEHVSEHEITMLFSTRFDQRGIPTGIDGSAISHVLAKRIDLGGVQAQHIWQNDDLVAIQFRQLLGGDNTKGQMRALQRCGQRRARHGRVGIGKAHPRGLSRARDVPLSANSTFAS